MTRLTGNQSMETDSVGEQEGLGRSCAGTGRPVLLSYSSTSTRCLYGTVRKASGSGWRLAFLASEVCGCSEHLAHYRIWAFTWVSPVHLYAGPPCDVVGAPLLATCVTIPGEDVHITMPGEGRQAVQGATVSLCRLAMAPPCVRTPAQRLLSYGGASSWKRY